MSRTFSNAIPSTAKLPGVSFGGVRAFRKQAENTILIAMPLTGTIYAMLWLAEHALTWIEVSAFVISYIVVGLGVGVGLHRYFSHRSFQPQRWLEYALGAAGSMAFQGSVLRWTADHRRHHAHTDHCGDLHSPDVHSNCSHTSTLRGLFHAHVGWMFDSSVTEYEIFAKDLLGDPTVMFFHRTHWLWPVALLLGVWSYGYALGGPEHAWGCLLLAGCARITLFHNLVWRLTRSGIATNRRAFRSATTARTTSCSPG
jgi:stearoyl-CoA desaturase (delta-9 desaturase)